jgi:hypothetical protein
MLTLRALRQRWGDKIGGHAYLNQLSPNDYLIEKVIQSVSL